MRTRIFLSIVLFVSFNALAQPSRLVKEWAKPLAPTQSLPRMANHRDAVHLSEKNKGTAFVMSLVLPGWGQHYTKSHQKMYAFIATEVGLWMTYSGFELYSDWRRQDYRNYAARYADVDLNGKSDSYFINVGNFNNIYDYNAYKLQWRQLSEYYKDVDAHYWNWQSEKQREKFDDLRISSDTAHNRATLVLGLIVANHLISAVDALISANRYNKRQASLDWNFYLGDGYYIPRVNLTLVTHW